jgi:hypothetical protein
VTFEKRPEIFWTRGDFYFWWNGAGKIYKTKPCYLYSKKTKTLKSSTYCKQHYSRWANYSTWHMMGGYAPSGSKSSGAAYFDIYRY